MSRNLKGKLDRLEAQADKTLVTHLGFWESLRWLPGHALLGMLRFPERREWTLECAAEAAQQKRPGAYPFAFYSQDDIKEALGEWPPTRERLEREIKIAWGERHIISIIHGDGAENLRYVTQAELDQLHATQGHEESMVLIAELWQKWRWSRRHTEERWGRDAIRLDPDDTMPCYDRTAESIKEEWRAGWDEAHAKRISRETNTPEDADTDDQQTTEG